MLAANIGAGSTSAPPGWRIATASAPGGGSDRPDSGRWSLPLLVAPRLWTLASEHDFYTTGDYLEFRYGPRVRARWPRRSSALGSLALLAGQLIAGAAILNVDHRHAPLGWRADRRRAS